MSSFDRQIRTTWKIYVVPHQVFVARRLTEEHFWLVRLCDGRGEGDKRGGRLVC